MATRKRQLRARAALNLDLFRPDTIQVPAPATIHTKIRQQAERVQGVANLLETDPTASLARLPSEEEMGRLFDHYNWMYFRGRLRRPKIEYSNRMTMAGAFIPDQRVIKISRRYHEIFPEEIADTLKHEMIHLLHMKHDSAFKSEAERIGASIKARTHPSLQRPPRYVYECPRCKTDFPRQKRLVMASCGYCSKGGKYDARFKLVLKSSPGRK